MKLKVKDLRLLDELSDVLDDSDSEETTFEAGLDYIRKVVPVGVSFFADTGVANQLEFRRGMNPEGERIEPESPKVCINRHVLVPGYEQEKAVHALGDRTYVEVEPNVTDRFFEVSYWKGKELILTTTCVGGNGKLGELEKYMAQRVIRKIGSKFYDQRRGVTDGLTRVHTRGYLDSRLPGEIDRAGRDHANLAVIMTDIDHFKDINDTYGHQTGDSVLRALGLTLKDGVRSSDIIARYGGEEFVIVLPKSSDMESAYMVAERLRQAFVDRKYLTPEWLEAGDIDLIKNITKDMTLSFGIAQYPDYKDADGLIQAADSALYASKESGRNRISWTGRNGVIHLLKRDATTIEDEIASFTDPDEAKKYQDAA